MSTNGGNGVPAVEVDSFDFSLGGVPILKELNFVVKPGTRTLLIGHNGAGKTTLLRVLAGKHLTKSTIQIFGKDAFNTSPQELGITYLGTEWASNPVVRSDILVQDFLASVGGNRYRDRRDVLLDILDVDLQWHMHQISDGERRRVQLVMGLMVPWRLLLLDEVTVDLDVLVRADLLAFLVKETESRQATIIYATHIFDGLHHFPTHLVHLSLGSPTTPKPIDRPFPYLFRVARRQPGGRYVEGEGGCEDELSQMARLGAPNPTFSKGLYEDPEGPAQSSVDDDRVGSQLLEMCLCWLREDRTKRRRLEEEGSLPRRGAPKEEKDKGKFYTKYDYWS